MMDFPRDFDTPAFPESRKIALSRLLAIWSGLAFLLIAALAVMFLWGRGAMRLEPYLIAIDSNTGAWSVISENTRRVDSLPSYHMVQESVAAKFAAHWFTIAPAVQENEIRWCKCDPLKCHSPRNDTSQARLPCFICCSASPGLFARFEAEVLPEYRLREAGFETWTLDTRSIQLFPNGEISERGGKWILHADLRSNKHTNPRPIIAYMTITMATTTAYPLSFGFYVSEMLAFSEDGTALEIPPIPIIEEEAEEFIEYEYNDEYLTPIMNNEQPTT